MDSSANWHHYSIVNDASANSQILYKDGSSVSTETYSDHTSHTTSKPLTIGARYDSQFTDMTMDQLLIHKEQLSASEVSALYSSGTIPTDNLFAHYDFEQTGTTLENQGTVTTTSLPDKSTNSISIPIDSRTYTTILQDWYNDASSMPQHGPLIASKLYTGSALDGLAISEYSVWLYVGGGTPSGTIQAGIGEATLPIGSQTGGTMTCTIGEIDASTVTGTTSVPVKHTFSGNTCTPDMASGTDWVGIQHLDYTSTSNWIGVKKASTDHFDGTATGYIEGTYSYVWNTPDMVFELKSPTGGAIAGTSTTGSIGTAIQDPNLTYTNTNLPDNTDDLSVGGWVKLEPATSYDLSNASYDSVSFSISSQETSGNGLTFSSDGTKMYVVGYAEKAVKQYTLSTAWDVSTASYDSVSFSVNSQEGDPKGLVFNSDGTKLYVVGKSSDTVYQYSLSTAWDVSTASYSSLSFSVTSQDTDPKGLLFNSDGTKLYIVGRTTDTVYQYSLSTGYDISTASYDSVSFSISSQDNEPQGIVFNSDGTKLLFLGGTSKTIYQYSLSTGYDLSTASYDTVSFDVDTQAGNPTELAFNSDGTKVFILDELDAKVYQYTTTVPTANTKLLGLNDITFNVGTTTADVTDNVLSHEGWVIDGNTKLQTAGSQYSLPSTGVFTWSFWWNPNTLHSSCNGSNWFFPCIVRFSVMCNKSSIRFS